MFWASISEVEEIQMKIFLTKENVKRILCDHFGIKYVEATRSASVPRVVLKGDEIYWEGSPEKCKQAPGTSLKE